MPPVAEEGCGRDRTVAGQLCPAAASPTGCLSSGAHARPHATATGRPYVYVYVYVYVYGHGRGYAGTGIGTGTAAPQRYDSEQRVAPTE